MQEPCVCLGQLCASGHSTSGSTSVVVASRAGLCESDCTPLRGYTCRDVTIFHKANVIYVEKRECLALKYALSHVDVL